MFRIIETKKVAQTFTIRGNKVSGFPASATFVLKHSQVGNDGTYTVSSSILDAYGNTVIYVTSQPSNDSSVDGSITLPIQAVTTGAGGSFKVFGDFSTTLVTPLFFKVFGSTGNDGLYQIASTSYIAPFTTLTAVNTQTVPNATADGNIVSANDYIINFSDPSKPTLLIGEQLTNSSDTSLSIPGRGSINHGELTLENVVHILESFASPTQPSNPIKGQIWFDTSSSPAQLKVYTGVSFQITNVGNFVRKDVSDTMGLNVDLTFNGGEVLGLPSTPSATGASSKEYTDTQVGSVSSSLSTHISDTTVHINSDQNTFLDNLNLTGLNPVSATEVNYLGGSNPVSSSVQTQLDDKVSKTTLSSQSINSTVTFNDDVTLGLNKDVNMNGGTVTGLPVTPSSSTDASSKAYVDALFSTGAVWKNPVTDPDIQDVVSTQPTPSGSVNDTFTYIKYGGTQGASWGSVTNVVDGDILQFLITSAPSTGTWSRVAVLSAGMRFIVAGEHGTVGATLFGAGVRKNDVIKYVSGTPSTLSAWTFPEDAGYQVINFTSAKVSGSATLLNTGLTYDLNVSIAGVNHNITVTGAGIATFGGLATALSTALNSAYTGASVVLEPEGHFHVYSGDLTKVIITEGSGLNPLLAGLSTDFDIVNIRSNVLAGIGDGYTILVNGSQSFHYGHTYVYTQGINSWTEIAGPGAVSAGTHLSYSGTTLNVDFSDSDVYIPSPRKLGIGQPSPSELLHLYSATTANIRIQNANGSFYIGNQSNDAVLNMNQAYNMIFKTSAIERMRIDSSGNVGIGKQLYGSLTTDGVWFAKGDLTHISCTTANGALYVNQNGSGPLLSINKAGVEKVAIDTNGNVGIGTSITNQKLTVWGGGSLPSIISNTQLLVGESDGFANAGIALVSSTANLGRVTFGDNTTPVKGTIAYDNTNNYMTFGTVNTERMRIDSLGRIGINNNNPNMQLHIKSSGLQLKLEGSGVGDNSEVYFTSNNQNYIRLGLVNGNNTFRIYDDFAIHERLRIDTNGDWTFNKSIGRGDFLSTSGGYSSTYNGLFLGSNTSSLSTQANAALSSWFVDIGGRAGDGTIFKSATQDKFRITRIAPGGNYLNTDAFLTIDSSGNPSFGTTSNNLTNASASNTILTMVGHASTYGSILEMGNFGTNANDQLLGRMSFWDGSSSNAQINVARSTTTDSAYIAIATRPVGGSLTERMRIDSSGNVGIGVTPINKLDVSQISRLRFDVANSYTNLISTNSANSAYTRLYFTASDYIWQTAGGDKLSLDSSGNLGIGVTPTTALTVKSPIAGSTYITVIPNTSSSGIAFRNSTNSVDALQLISTDSLSTFGSTTSIPLVLQTSGTERMRIDNAGKVSIGATSATVDGTTSRLLIANINYEILGLNNPNNSGKSWVFGINDASLGFGTTGRLSIHQTVSGSLLGVGGGPAVPIISMDVPSVANAIPRLLIDANGNTSLNAGSLYNYTEAVTTATGINTTQSPNCSTNSMYQYSLTGNITITPTGATAGRVCNLTVIIINGGSARTLTWTNVRWNSGSVPTASTGTDIYSMFTIDGGSNWYGFQAGKGMA